MRESIAEFESVGANQTKGHFTGQAEFLSVIAKVIRSVFVSNEKIIDKYAENASKEIVRRRR